MATKTLTITEDAYERLSMVKGKNESFSDVITKHFPKHSLMELAGILTQGEAAELRKNIGEHRLRSKIRFDEITKRLQ